MRCRERVFAGLGFAVAAMFALPTRGASAQALSPPRARLDVDFGYPGLIAAPGAGIRPSLAAAVGVRFVTRPGFGVGVAFAGAGDLSSNTGTSVETAHPEGWLFDATAIYRLRPLGDDRTGLGIDLAVGASLGNLGWDPGHSAYDRACGLFALACNAVETVHYASPAPTYTTGGRVGPVVALGVDGRIRGLVFGVGATYRALVYYGDRAPVDAEPAALHVVTATAHLGFGLSL
ncbi:MAG: hypothetical protein EPO40_27325 [Myxococcaceae bacterium]|nr:MAG: hypothetical protein EPO40_27325 [Myxococcaceae bacterium]